MEVSTMGRTKGSKNGISTTPGYIAIGEKAKGILMNPSPAPSQSMSAKEKNPAMPTATAKYLDKLNGIVANHKSKSNTPATSLPNIRPQQKQEPVQQPKKKSGFSLKKLTKQLKQFADKAAEKAEIAAVRNVGPGEIKKMAKSKVADAAEKALPTYEGRKASKTDYLDDFMVADVADRINDAKKKGKQYINNTVSRLLDDERIQGDLRDLAEAGYKNQNDAVKVAANKVLDPKNTRKYMSVAADAAIPTYEGRKASDKNRFGEFMKADIQDRINDAKKKAKEVGVNKVTKKVNTVLKDKRIASDIEALKKDPIETAKKIVNDVKSNPESAKKYKQVAADAAVPTYEKRKASTDDSLFDFVANDIQDRINDKKKKAKKKLFG
jgi:hypothetical protein